MTSKNIDKHILMTEEVCYPRNIDYRDISGRHRSYRKKRVSILWLFVCFISLFCLVSVGFWYVHNKTVSRSFNIYIINSDNDSSIVKFFPKSLLDKFGLYSTSSNVQETTVDFQEVTTDKNPPSTNSPVCSGISDIDKFDCYPDAPVTESQCIKRGCCYRAVVVQPVITNRTNYPPLGTPYCYYPSNYVGYQTTNISSTDHGFRAVLQRIVPSGFPNDIQKLNLAVIIIDDNTLEIKITDSNSTRFEVPILKHYVKKTVSKGSLLYNVNLTSDGILSVVRKSSGITLFNTSLSRLVFANQFLQLSTNLPSPFLYGLGEHYEQMLKNVNWTRSIFFNRDRVPTSNVNLYGSHPFYIVVEKDGSSHGVFLLNSNSMEVVLQPTPALTYRTIGGILDLFVFLGPKSENVVQQYTQVVGRPFMPPYWSLGFQLCKYGYNSLNETRKVWQRTIEAEIPFDVQWNDIDYMDRHNDFTYDKVNFDGLPEFVDEIHKQGMHYVIMVDPGISNAETPGTYPPYDEGVLDDLFIKNSTGGIFIGKVWNSVSTVFPDFSHPAAEAYWTRQFKSFHNLVPFDGAWIDMNEPSNFLDGTINGCPKNSSLENPPYVPGGLEPLRTRTVCMTAKHHNTTHYNEHNLYAYREAAATNHALKNITGKRPFIISRASFSGQGFYGGHWSGDIVSSWEDMRYSIIDLLNFNMFGITMMGSDICGFGGNTTVELCARWSALGAFYPFSRNHNDLNGIPQDPVALGPLVVMAAKTSLTVRYSLLPYLYTLFYRSHVFGETVARPLFFEYPQDINTYNIDEQFLWGSAFMIMPALYPGISNITVYFPKGLWYDFFSGEKRNSKGEDFTLQAPLEIINLAVRGGYILPMQFPNITTTASRLNKFILFAGLNENKEAIGELYWDDGDSLGTYERKEYNLIKFSISDNTLTTAVINSKYATPMVLGLIRVCSLDSAPTNVTANGKAIEHKFDEISHCLYVDTEELSLLATNIIIWK